MYLKIMEIRVKRCNYYSLHWNFFTEEFCLGNLNLGNIYFIKYAYFFVLKTYKPIIILYHLFTFRDAYRQYQN